ncbi:MAG: hypothetical protein J6C09_05975 [Clostridia bacterium]|nr:hypothetical protein [Clostridia bacterium]
MIYYSLSEIALSVLSALVYGLIFAFSLIFVKSALVRAYCFVQLFFTVCFCFSGGSLKEKIRDGISGARESLRFGNLSAFLTVLLFTVGIILLSYYSLDGAVRIYTVALSLLTATSLYKYARAPIEALFDKLLFVILFFFGIAVGVPLSFVKRIVLRAHSRIKH